MLFFIFFINNNYAYASSNKMGPRIATVYLHGYDGGPWSTDYMIYCARKSNFVTNEMTATVNYNGKVHFSGKWPKNCQQCLVQVIFKRNDSFQAKQEQWLTKILKMLKKYYNASEYNGVGHSLGCNILLNEALWYGHSKSIPKLQKLVMIAGPFNGVLWLNDEANRNSLNKLGVPAIMTAIYLNSFYRKKYFPHNVKVLNITGNLDIGSNSDKYVSVASSKSLGFILKGVAKSYRDIEFYGPNAEHSKLHQNKKVIKDVNQFLWGK